MAKIEQKTILFYRLYAMRRAANNGFLRRIIILLFRYIRYLLEASSLYVHLQVTVMIQSTSVGPVLGETAPLWRHQGRQTYNAAVVQFAIPPDRRMK